MGRFHDPNAFREPIEELEIVGLVSEKGLAEMDMRLDETGQDVQAGPIEDFSVFRGAARRGFRRDLRDPPVDQPQVRAQRAAFRVLGHERGADHPGFRKRASTQTRAGMGLPGGDGWRRLSFHDFGPRAFLTGTTSSRRSPPSRGYALAFHGIVRATTDIDFRDQTRQVDVLIRYDLKDLETERISWNGLKIPVVTLKSLLKMKLEAGRPQDLVHAEKIREKIKASRK
jgi:hypothetical protein